MSSHGSAYRGYPTYNGLAPQTDPWSKTSYVSDHVCKPVIVDAEGRKHPIVYNSGSTTEACITKTETVVQQQVHLPFSTEYKHSSPTEVESPNHHGYVEDKWHQSSSPVHDRPHKVEEFFTKVQTEVSQPKKFGLLSPPYGHQFPNSTGYHGPGNTGYGDYNDKSNKDWPKPSGNTIWKGNYDGNYHNQNNDSRMEPTVITSGGWTRPSRAGWAAPPDTSLSRPTNDIGTLTTSPHSRYPVPITTGLKKDGYGETIDSREASKRYGHFPRSFQTEEKYTATIDSTEAARKYKGAGVPM